jgi:hypothetical protein
MISLKLYSSRREPMLTGYIQKALEKALYKVLEDGTWFSEIPGFQGV